MSRLLYDSEVKDGMVIRESKVRIVALMDVLDKE